MLQIKKYIWNYANVQLLVFYNGWWNTFANLEISVTKTWRFLLCMEIEPSFSQSFSIDSIYHNQLFWGIVCRVYLSEFRDVTRTFAGGSKYWLKGQALTKMNVSERDTLCISETQQTCRNATLKGVPWDRFRLKVALEKCLDGVNSLQI